MQITLEQLAQELGADFDGDGTFTVMGLKAPEQAESTDLIVLLEPVWREAVIASAAKTVLLPRGMETDGLLDRNLLFVEHPRAAFAQALDLFYPDPPVSLHSVHVQAIVAPNVDFEQPLEIKAYTLVEDGVKIGSGTRIGPHCTIGQNSSIGRDCRIGPNVTLASGTVMGDRVIIHPGTVIGADGYGFYYEGGRHHKIRQVGTVRIDSDVEIGANVTIDRGTLGETVIGEGTKIDNLVQIGHNVRIGKHCLLISQVGIAGSTVLGDYVTLAGQTGVAGHLQIGDKVIAAGKSGITKDIPAGLKISGFPAQDHRRELKQQAALRRLPETLDKLKQQL